MTDRSDSPKSGEDRMVLGPAMGDDHHLYVRKNRDDKIDIGVAQVQPLEEAGEGTLLLRRRPEGDYDVSEVVKVSGPAKVNNTAFRNNWDRIFGPAGPRGQA